MGGMCGGHQPEKGHELNLLAMGKLNHFLLSKMLVSQLHQASSPMTMKSQLK